MESEANPVIAACEAEWNKWKSDCSGFAKTVAHRLGLVLSGPANSMIDSLEDSARWVKLGADKKAAITRAQMGFLVIGGLKARGHGHVVIVVNTASTGYPIAYWGRFGAVGKKRTAINWSWNKPDWPKSNSMRRSYENHSARPVLLRDDGNTCPECPCRRPLRPDTADPSRQDGRRRQGDGQPRRCR